MAGGYKLQSYKATKLQSYKGTSEAMDESQLKGKLWYCVDRQHGGRDVVSMADLRLLLRRSPELLAMCDPEGSQ